MNPSPTPETDTMGHTNPFDDDKLHEECGVFGIFGHTDAAALTALGLHALQHRGQEAAGIVSYHGENQQYYSHRGLGHVGDNFGRDTIIKQLPGNIAIGHNRYATTGDTVLRNVQPLFAELSFGGFAVCHNGNLTNSYDLRQRLVSRGCIFQSTMDTETILHLVAISDYSTVVDRVIDAARQIEGAYSLVAMTADAVVGVRDPHGVRPLVMGRIDDSYILTSETCALDIIGAEYIRDIDPGELVVISEAGVRSIKPFPKQPRRFCIFEYIYFARPDSSIEGRSVYESRTRIGAELARESHVPADVIIPVPDSGVPAAVGYAHESGIPFELGIIRNHYVGRTFIEPTDSIRHLGVKLKHNANRAVIEGKRVVLVDDSIVRGTTSRKIVEMVRRAGAKEVHMRISSPPTTHPCYYGIDTPEKEELMASRFDLAGMAREIGVDSLAYITMDGLYRAMGEEARNADAPQYCDACFSGEYPISVFDRQSGKSPVQLSLLSESA
jgi:amidophosphoribosyltransferase